MAGVIFIALGKDNVAVLHPSFYYGVILLVVSNFLGSFTNYKALLWLAIIPAVSFSLWYYLLGRPNIWELLIIPHRFYNNN